MDAVKHVLIHIGSFFINLASICYGATLWKKMHAALTPAIPAPFSDDEYEESEKVWTTFDISFLACYCTALQ